MRLPHVLLVGAWLASAAGASAQVVRPSAPQSPEAVLAAKCKAASYARRPAGEMATTMRELQIKRCIKNNGFLD
jgi:hypothetical protein